MSVDVAAHPPAVTSTNHSSPAVPPIDLRHMTSNTLLASDGRRVSQHLQATATKGSRSPASIPSSPTSVHSSSSAIFERDIEPIHVSPSMPGSKKDPHRITRSKNKEVIEQSVPSVLDSAASILTSMTADDGDSIAVITPAQLPPSSLLDQVTIRSRGSGFASPIGSFRSRSPSPSTRAGNRTSLLLNIPPPGQLHSQSQQVSPTPASAPPTARQFDSVVTTPISALGENAYITGTVRTPGSGGSSSSKRLSFMSYTDLLASTPAATQPLSALTSPSSSPSHIPGVGVAIGDATSVAGSAYTGSGAPSLRNFAIIGDEDRTMDDVGGEWEREGLGRGLEERLEALQGFGMA